MHPSRRRKKRPNYGIRTVEVLRGVNGFGFTISGQQPCILSCIVANSPADHAGLRAGDFLISVNGISVSKITHDAVVNLIGNCVGPIKMTIAENYYSDSSEEELDVNRMISARKPKYMHKPRTHRLYKHAQRTMEYTNNSKPCILTEKHPNEIKPAVAYNISNQIPLMEDEAGPVEYKALVGYLGTIEMPKQLLPNSRLQTVCSCIRKLRQEKRAPTAVLMTIFPTCLTLKNSSNHILAIYPTNRVVYIGSTADRESRYFGLVTSAVADTQQKQYNNIWPQEEKKFNNNADSNEIDISNSCHVFMIDPKIVEHSIHVKKAESFKISCTADVVTGNCLEFPRNALYIVNLIQSMYKLQNDSVNKDDLGPLVANSPQPSASSNSDSGIGFRDDCGNVSDRILVVEFPAHRPLPVISSNNNRPAAFDASSIPMESLDLLNNGENYELNNIRCKNNLDIKLPNNLSNKNENYERNSNIKQMNNLNNIRACESVNIKNNMLEKSDNFLLAKQNNDADLYNSRLTCRAMPDRPMKMPRGVSPSSIVSSDDNNTRSADNETGQIYAERAVDVPENCPKYEGIFVSEDVEFQSSVDNISVHSGKSIELSNLNSVFKTPSTIFFDNNAKKAKRQCKMVNSCENLDKFNKNLNYKLSPKVYGLSKPNHSCEELNNLDSVEKCGFGSLQDLYSWNGQSKTMRNIAQSEPDVRIRRNGTDEQSECEENGSGKGSTTEGPAGWASSFEKLLDDPLGLHTFAEFLKKEFSAENIYFWTACERYRRLPAGPERAAEAQRIYQQHLCVGAPEPVNVDAHGRQCTEQSLQEASVLLFEQAQKQIFNLMKFDSYPRFLKSNLYKQCLAGDVEKPQLDAGLLLQPNVMTPSKLKKSLSNAEDRRRKSLLPWHRKNRSKSKDRGESEYNQRRNDIIASDESVNMKEGCGSDIHSSKSSLTSLDLAISSVQGSQDELSTIGRGPLCRVILSNGSTTVVQIKTSETIQQLVSRLLDKRGLTYSAFEVYTDKHPKALDVNEASSKLAGCEVTVEQRVVFKLDLPNKKVISVKSKFTKIIADVLRPILLKYNYNLDQAKVSLNENEMVDIHLPVTSIDGARLRIQYCDDLVVPVVNPVIKVNNAKVSKLEEITNQVFEGILQDKADAAFLKPKSDKGSVKSEDWGSEHSSGIIGRFLRRDSGLHERKKKALMPRTKNVEDVEQAKKPLIAKWKTGVNKLQVACSESDELVEGLTRAQRSRLEDQRGTEINFELPDFLKDKDNERGFRKPLRCADSNNSRFYLDSEDQQSKRLAATTPVKNMSHYNYENRNILPKDFNNLSNNNTSFTNQNKLTNLRIYSPNKFSSDESSKSNQSTPSKSLENTVIENKRESPKSVEPPPLPPKPKIIPIKPPNWGQNGFYKSKDVTASDKSKTLYLEQPSSSFV